MEECAVDMRDAHKGHGRAVGQGDCRTPAADRGCRDHMGHSARIFAREGDPVAMGLVEADDRIMAGCPTILDQRTSGPGKDVVLARSAIDGIGAASTKYRVVSATKIDLIGAAAAMDQRRPLSAIDRIRAGPAIDRIGAIAAKDEVRAGAAGDETPP